MLSVKIFRQTNIALEGVQEFFKAFEITAELGTGKREIELVLQGVRLISELPRNVTEVEL